MDAPFTLLTNHAAVLLCLARDDGARLRDVALATRLTERAVQRIVAELEESGFLTRAREGRRNRYRVHRERALGDLPCSLGALLELADGPRVASPRHDPTGIARHQSFID